MSCGVAPRARITTTWRKMAQKRTNPSTVTTNETARFIAAKSATKLSSTVTKRLGVHVEKREMVVSLSAGKSAATVPSVAFLYLHVEMIVLYVVAQIRGGKRSSGEKVRGTFREFVSQERGVDGRRIVVIEEF